MNNIDPTAIVRPTAVLGSHVSVGPFCVIEDNVQIGDQCQLASHCVVKSGTTIGRNTKVAEGAVIGGAPQHLAAGDVLGRLAIGEDNTIRENVTIHRGLRPDDTTQIGDRNFIMVSVHIGHDCDLGNDIILANNVMLAGHVTVQDHAYFSGAAGVHQFCRVGAYAMVGGQAHLSQDVPPYVTVDGLSSHVVGFNKIGLKRKGFTREDIAEVKAIYRLMYRSGLIWNELLDALGQLGPRGQAYREFLEVGKRGFVTERRSPRGANVRISADESPKLAEDTIRKVG